MIVEPQSTAQCPIGCPKDVAETMAKTSKGSFLTFIPLNSAIYPVNYLSIIRAHHVRGKGDPPMSWLCTLKRKVAISRRRVTLCQTSHVKIGTQPHRAQMVEWNCHVQCCFGVPNYVVVSIENFLICGVLQSTRFSEPHRPVFPHIAWTYCWQLAPRTS